MKIAESTVQPGFPAVGEESFAAVQGAVRAALAEHGRNGRAVIVWRNGQAVELFVDENGDEIVEA